MTSNTAKTSRYRCSRCGACCRWPGYVRVTEAEVDAIAQCLGTPVDRFINDWTELTDDRRGLTLVENDDNTCCFLAEDGACRINPVKPKQCRDFPNEWNFPGWRDICQAQEIPDTD